MTAAAGRRDPRRRCSTYRPVQPRRAARPAPRSGASRINDYIGRLNQPRRPARERARSSACTRHLQATDPDRFVVATRPDADTPAGERIVAFASAVVRERLWFLSMCFVLPELQGSGVGRACSTGSARRTATHRPRHRHGQRPADRNALYASLGIVPRVPLLNLIGLPSRPDAFGRLPSGIRPVPFERDRGPPGGHGTAASSRRSTQLDRATLGVAHPDRPSLPARGGPARLALSRARTGAPLGYGYATRPAGSGPVAVRDRDARGPDPRPPDSSGRRRAARSRCGCRARPTGRSWRRSGPASGSTSSRSCCAGTARSPTWRATCRSRPDCSRPTATVRTGPSSGWPVARSVPFARSGARW